jgi:hemolysin III
MKPAAAAHKPNGSVLPLSMRLLRSMGSCSCCCNDCHVSEEADAALLDDMNKVVLGGPLTSIDQDDKKNGSQRNGEGQLQQRRWNVAHDVSPWVVEPMMARTAPTELQQSVMERILHDYRLICQFYHCEVDAAVLTTIRFSLPSLRTSLSAAFHDNDMLALCELLFRYANGPLQHIRRLDFSRRTRVRSLPSMPLRNLAATGFGSHGALALAKLLQHTQYISELYLERNRIGPYGASALFIACSTNPTLQQLSVRRCRVGERGGLAFAAYAIPSPTCGLLLADLSANAIGYRGSLAIEYAMQTRVAQDASSEEPRPHLVLDMEGNLVFQEIMNSVTHGLGILLALVGACMMSAAVQDRSLRHRWSCGVYSTSLVVLYTSSTLYHSFFTLRHTKWVFEVIDKCAIYILIAGSYTPFLQIVLSYHSMFSEGLLLFLWSLCVMGVGVEFALPTWKQKGTFSLAMFLGMGWSALVCLPEVARIIPLRAIHLMTLGGLAYTAGVPFFVRNNSTFFVVFFVGILVGFVSSHNRLVVQTWTMRFGIYLSSLGVSFTGLECFYMWFRYPTLYNTNDIASTLAL